MSWGFGIGKAEVGVMLMVSSTWMQMEMESKVQESPGWVGRKILGMLVFVAISPHFSNFFPCQIFRSNRHDKRSL